MQEEETKDDNKRKRIKARYTTKYYSSYAFNRIKKKYPQVKMNDVHRALTMYFELAQEDLATGQKISFLNKLGGLYLSKERRGVEYNEETGKITNKLPINIPETQKLWKLKPELKNKTFVRFTNDHSDNYLFKLHFEASKAIFKNKQVYKFQFHRLLKRKLVDNIHDKKVDAYIINKRSDEQ